MPTQEEIDAIKAHVDTSDGLFYYFFMFAGLRLGEALALRWKDIDSDKNVIHVTRSLYWAGQNTGRFKVPKTDAGTRDVIYLERLRNMLEPRRSSPEHYVFGGESPMTHRAYLNTLKRCKKIANSDCVPHELRHAFATLCFEADVPVKTTQGLLGHAQISTTMDIYTELRNRKLAEAATSLNNTDF